MLAEGCVDRHENNNEKETIIYATLPPCLYQLEGQSGIVRYQEKQTKVFFLFSHRHSHFLKAAWETCFLSSSLTGALTALPDVLSILSFPTSHREMHSAQTQLLRSVNLTFL